MAAGTLPCFLGHPDGIHQDMAEFCCAEPLRRAEWNGPSVWTTQEVYSLAWQLQGALEAGRAVKVQVPTRNDQERLLTALSGVPARLRRLVFMVPVGGLRVG